MAQINTQVFTETTVVLNDNERHVILNSLKIVENSRGLTKEFKETVQQLIEQFEQGK